MFVWIVERNTGSGWEAYSGICTTREQARADKQHYKYHYSDYKFRIRKYVREEE